MHQYTIRELTALYRSKKTSPVEIVKEYRDRFQKQDPLLNTGITPITEAEQFAKEAEKAYQTGKAGPLCGVPIAIKDNICFKGTRTTCASKMLEHFTPPYMATAAQHLLSCGAIPLYKANMDEFAMGGSGETSYFGPSKNPFDPTRVTGGSSSGSAASVAAGLSVAALGTDTGGSIRQPAAFCGVTGIKPTYGTVSRYGLVAFASSLDQIGPLARSAEDCGMILNGIMGWDPHDSTTVRRNVPDNCEKIGTDIRGMRLAVIRELMGEGISAPVRKAVLQAVKTLEAQGATVEEVSLPGLDHAIAAYYLIASAEASSNLSRYDGVKYGYRTAEYANIDTLYCNTRKEGFGWEVKRRIILGTYALCSGFYDDYYKKAVFIKEKLKESYASIFAKYDAILSPTAPTTAYRLGEQILDPVQMYSADICTVTVNLAGLPAVSTPCGYDQDGMPIGLSIIGRPFAEATILGLADSFERSFTRRDPDGKEAEPSC